MENLAEVKTKIGRLSPKAAANILSMASDVLAVDSSFAKEIRLALIIAAARGRREHGRRLFTIPLEPLLIDEEDVLRPDRSAPAALHRADVAAAWRWLLADPTMTEADAEVRRAADDAVRGGTMFPAVLTPATAAAARRLFVRCGMILERTFADQAAVYEAVRVIGLERAEEERRLRIALRSFSSDHLALIRDVMLNPGLVERGAWEGDLHWPASSILPVLTSANGRGDFGPAMTMVSGGRMDSFSKGTIGMLAEAHLRAATERLCVMLESGTRMKTEDDALFRMVCRLAGAVETYAAGGFGIGREEAGALGEAARLLVSGKRTFGGLKSAVSEAVSGHGNMQGAAAVVRAACIMATVLPEGIREGAAFRWLVADLVEIMRLGARSAVQMESGREWRDIFAHLDAIRRMAEPTGEDAAGWFQITDHGILKLSTLRLGDAAPLSPFETRLIADLLRKARREFGLTVWKDPVVVSFSEAAERRVAAPPPHPERPPFRGDR